jgi:aminoglycoside phosphotransferase family enzyme/predicted kinase
VALDDAIKALSEADAYRECGTGELADMAPIETRQTHISVVFLAGGFAWKVKKPVDLGFLDFSTLAKRRHFCEEEVRVNRRTAPELYLGVDAVVRDPDGSLRLTSDPGDREVVEVAVRMRRLPEQGLFDHQLEQGSDESGLSERTRIRAILSRFAVDLAAFHAASPTGPGIDEHGGSDGMRRQFEENFARLAPLTGEGELDAISPRRFAWLKQQGFARLALHRDLLAQRVEAGRVREGHGDLHAGNLCEVDGRLLAFDAIEFDRRMRCRDVACEAAHLAMDLDRRGFAVLAAQWTRAYAGASNDRAVIELGPLFRFHYALVRTLVEAIRSRDPNVPDASRATSLVSARRYADLATGYLLPPSIVLTCGLPGTGKSTMARAIAKPLRALVLRSDIVRKRLAGVAIDDRSGLDASGGSLYSPEWTGRTYASLRDAAEAGLRRGRHVVVDAAFSRASQRAMFADLADRSDVPKRPFILVEATCDREVVRQRLAQRAADRREPSDADWSVYEQAERAFERPLEIAERRKSVWPGDAAVAEGVRAVFESLVSLDDPVCRS